MVKQPIAQAHEMDQIADEKPVSYGVEDAENALAAANAGTIVEDSSLTGRAALRPQPSNDPNDPLNWSVIEKYTTYFPICFFAFLATVHTSKFAVAVGPVGAEFKTASTETAFLICFPVLALGLGNFFWVIVIRLVGRRPAYLAAMPILCAMNIWSYFARSFGALLAASVIAAFAAACAESPTSAVVADLFFVHQRGTMLMMFHLALSAGFFVGPLINAYCVQYAGWRWMCGWLAIATGILWIISIFTIHETTYRYRNIEKLETDYAPKKTFVQRLSLTLGYNPKFRFLETAWNTIYIVAYPGVLWSGLVIGAFVGWNIVVQLTSARLLTAAPYNWQLHNLGLLALAGFTGALIAMFFGGRLIDIVANRMTTRAQGRREPEYRLPSIVFPAAIGPMGVLTFGLCITNKTHWIGPAFGYGMQGFGLTAVSNVLVTYAVDSYLPLAGETLVVVFVVRGCSGCLLSLYAFNWIQATGMANAFGQMVAIQYFLILFTVVFVVWGKKIRIATASYGPLKMLRTREAESHELVK